MKRFSVIALTKLALALAGGSAAAQVPLQDMQQTGPVSVSEGLALFEERCRLALFDPNAFIASVPPTLPIGGSAFSQSPDQQILTAHEYRVPWFIEFYISSTGNQRMLRCSAHNFAEFGYNPTPEAPDVLAQKLTAAFAARSDGTLVGGLMPRNYAQMYGRDMVDVPEFHQHYYAASLDWYGERVPVWIDVHAGGLSFITVRIEETGQ
ncbi:MAG: hypothetical protein AAGA38_14435 [Pseudomonadota bacterium]